MKNKYFTSMDPKPHYHHAPLLTIYLTASLRSKMAWSISSIVVSLPILRRILLAAWKEQTPEFSNVPILKESEILFK